MAIQMKAFSKLEITLIVWLSLSLLVQPSFAMRSTGAGSELAEAPFDPAIAKKIRHYNKLIKIYSNQIKILENKPNPKTDSEALALGQEQLEISAKLDDARRRLAKLPVQPPAVLPPLQKKGGEENGNASSTKHAINQGQRVTWASPVPKLTDPLEPLSRGGDACVVKPRQASPGWWGPIAAVFEKLVQQQKPKVGLQQVPTLVVAAQPALEQPDAQNDQKERIQSEIQQLEGVLAAARQEQSPRAQMNRLLGQLEDLKRQLTALETQVKPPGVASAGRQGPFQHPAQQPGVNSSVSQALDQARLALAETRAAYDQYVKDRSLRKTSPERDAYDKSQKDDPRSVLSQRLALQNHIKVLVGRILSDPGALEAYLAAHVRGRDPHEARAALNELIENKEAESPEGRIRCIVELAGIHPQAAIRAFENNFPENGWPLIERTVNGLPAASLSLEVKQRFLALFREVQDPAQRERRVVLRRSADDIRTSRELERGFVLGSDRNSPDGWLLAGEGAMHYDLMHEGLHARALVFSNPETVRDGGQLNLERFRHIGDHLSGQFAGGGKGLGTVVVGNGGHWVTLVVDRDQRSITVVDSMQNSGYFSPDELKAIQGVFQRRGLFPGTGPVRTSIIAAGQQRDGQNCMIFALLNAHQVAKRGDVNAYQEVTHAIAQGRLNSYGDIQNIGPERLPLPGKSYEQGLYRGFMKNFRDKTLELLRAQDDAE